jgi:hypothetical protein
LSRVGGDSAHHLGCARVKVLAPEGDPAIRRDHLDDVAVLVFVAVASATLRAQLGEGQASVDLGDLGFDEAVASTSRCSIVSR